MRIWQLFKISFLHKRLPVNVNDQRGKGVVIQIDSISTSQYMQNNHYNRPKALSELKEMVDDEQLYQIGNARTVMYIKKEK